MSTQKLDFAESAMRPKLREEILNFCVVTLATGQAAAKCPATDIASYWLSYPFPFRTDALRQRSLSSAIS